MKKTLKVLVVVFAFLCAIGATFFITLHEAQQMYAAGYDPATEKVSEIMEYMRYYFIDDYDPEAMADAAATALVEASGDQWSYYLTAEEYVEYQEYAANAYVGIGVTIVEDADAGGMRVQTVTSGGPAEQAGIQVGDLITAVDGEQTLPLGVSGTRDLVRGEAGTDVVLSLLRADESLEVRVTRASIETAVAACTLLDDGIGYITIENFDERCAQETIACIAQMLDEGAQALLFDVRFNGGGYQEELVQVLDYLLPEGVIFQSRDYAGVEETERSDAASVDVPMAVLVNEESYSAAEYFAAALQEYGAAAVVGTQTTGKGNFQVGFELSDGSYLNLSIGKYFTPQGKSLTDVGITPDVDVDPSDDAFAQLYYDQLSLEEDAQLQAALAYLQEKIS